MTMTIRERKRLQSFVDAPHASGTLQHVVCILAQVALKQEAIRIAQAPPGSTAIKSCARCGVDLYPDDDFYIREENGAAVCWPQAPGELKGPGKPCFKGRRK